MASEISFVSALLREKCCMSCNPSSVMQRMVKGGRGSKESEKMSMFKRNCSQGCEIAINMDKHMSSSLARSVSSWGDASNDSVVMSASELEAQEEAMVKSLKSLRKTCYSKCEETCASDAWQGGDQEKCTRACSQGCDSLFDLFR
eukprot:a524952_144.p1 GENE.a524952_144~~a524952_144.p1  ORF type:complete len:158 (+),score=43.00 a524952_144:42-476(+)